MCVDLRRDNAPVAEEAVDVADICSLFEEVRGDRVTEYMRCDGARQSGVFAKLANESSDVPWRRGSAPGVDEKRIGRASTRLASVSVGDDQLADLGVGDVTRRCLLPLPMIVITPADFSLPSR